MAESVEAGAVESAFIQIQSNGCEFQLREAFNSLYYDALKKDLAALMTDSQEWWPADFSPLFEGRDRKTDKLQWTATRADLIFGSDSQLRSLSEVYASSGANEKFVHDFIAAWSKVMNLGRFDIQ